MSRQWSLPTLKNVDIFKKKSEGGVGGADGSSAAGGAGAVAETPAEAAIRRLRENDAVCVGDTFVTWNSSRLQDSSFLESKVGRCSRRVFHERVRAWGTSVSFLGW